MSNQGGRKTECPRCGLSHTFSSCPRCNTSRYASYYDILGVSMHATIDEIKQAYRRLVRNWHPDSVSSESEATINLHQEIMKQLNVIKGVLMDDRLREIYNRKMGIGNYQSGRTKKNKRRNEFEYDEQDAVNDSTPRNPNAPWYLMPGNLLLTVLIVLWFMVIGYTVLYSIQPDGAADPDLREAYEQPIGDAAVTESMSRGILTADEYYTLFNDTLLNIFKEGITLTKEMVCNVWRISLLQNNSPLYNVEHPRKEIIEFNRLLSRLIQNHRFLKLEKTSVFINPKKISDSAGVNAGYKGAAVNIVIRQSAPYGLSQYLIYEDRADFSCYHFTSECAKISEPMVPNSAVARSIQARLLAEDIVGEFFIFDAFSQIIPEIEISASEALYFREHLKNFLLNGDNVQNRNLLRRFEKKKQSWEILVERISNVKRRPDTSDKQYSDNVSEILEKIKNSSQNWHHEESNQIVWNDYEKDWVNLVLSDG